MKKASAVLLGALLVLMFNSNAWAHSGLRVDLISNGFGFSISDGHTGLSAFRFESHRPYFPNTFTSPYPYRPYLGWGGYRGHNHHGQHGHWGHQRHGQHHQEYHQPGHQRGHRHGGYGQHHRGHQRPGHHRNKNHR